jgi:hypothetical protein
MQLDRQLAVGFFDLRVAGVAVNPEYFVIIPFAQLW